MSAPHGFGRLTIRAGRSAGEIERDVLGAMRRHLAGRADLKPSEREAAAQGATRAVLARLRRRESGR